MSGHDTLCHGKALCLYINISLVPQEARGIFETMFPGAEFIPPLPEPGPERSFHSTRDPPVTN